MFTTQFNLPVVFFLFFTSHVINVVENSFSEDEAQCMPQQVHLSYGDSLDKMVVMWATLGPCSTKIKYGLSPWLMNQEAVGQNATFTESNSLGLKYLHRVEIMNLPPSSTIFYRPMSNSIGSEPFYFKTPPESSVKMSPGFLVFGDLGVQTQTIPSLVEEALKGEYTALLHVGDFAYNMHDKGGQVGDEFMRLIEPVAAYLPYMTSPGNHEITGDTFAHYQHRFSMPGTSWPIPLDKMWYSFNVGPVHFVSYSSEVFFTLNGSMITNQHNWLVDDLTKANERRSGQPWIIAYGHRPMYCSTKNDDDCTKNNSLVRTGLEDLFYNFGVDLVLQAHEHNYERLYPMMKGIVLSKDYVNPKAPVQIISGAAGSKHGFEVFQPLPQPDWSAERVAGMAFNSYGRLHIYNDSHLHWEQCSFENGTIIDSLLIVQHNHGKFQLSDLPAIVGNQVKESLPITESMVTEVMPSGDVKQDSGLVSASKPLAIGLSLGILVIIAVAVVAVFKLSQKKKPAAHRWDMMEFNYDKKLYAPTKEEAYYDDDFELDMADGSLPTRKLLSNSD